MTRLWSPASCMSFDGFIERALGSLREFMEDDGQAFIYTPLGNYAGYDLSVSETTLADRNSIMGLGDGGVGVMDAM